MTTAAEIICEKHVRRRRWSEARATHQNSSRNHISQCSSVHLIGLGLISWYFVVLGLCVQCLRCLLEGGCKKRADDHREETQRHTRHFLYFPQRLSSICKRHGSAAESQDHHE